MKLTFLFRKYHKWLALIVGVQALIWSISGLYMTAIHIDFIHGDHLVKPLVSTSLPDQFEKRLATEILDTKLSIDSAEIQSVQLTYIEDKPAYLIRSKDQLIRLDAASLQVLPEINAEQIKVIANKVYAGQDKIIEITLLPEYPSELGGRKQPIWKVQFDDWLESTLYFLPETGALRSKRSNLWRVFDFLWMLHIMDYEAREDVNNTLLNFAASFGLLLTLSGIALLTVSFRKSAINIKSNGFLVIKKVHKWLALLIGIQLVLWMVSGLMFSLLAHKEVQGGYLISKPVQANWTNSTEDFPLILQRFSDITSIKNTWLLAKPAYLVKSLKAEFVVDANTLQKIEISESIAKQIALQRYTGDGEIIEVIRESEKTLENRKFSQPGWRINFSDQENTSLYLSAQTGQIYGAKTDTWRLFDIFWMLHIMDYSERDDMNNALVIFVAALGCFIALSGVLMIFSVFKLSDFNWLARFKRVPILLKGSNAFSNEIFAIKNSRLIDSLAIAGFDLPSNCGGGGSCGLCRVKVDSSAPISDADNQLISQQDLESGDRLACQIRLEKGLQVELPDQVIGQQVFSSKVLSTEFKTPLIKEIKLEVPNNIEFEFKAGEYVLVHVPQGATYLKDIEVAPQYLQTWQNENIQQLQSYCPGSLSRAYSMANPPVDNQQIVLNVRLSLPQNPSGESGKASSYLFSLKPGDEIRISGSFGHFHALDSEASDSQKEMVFIGGGAGMAPLRSHILHQLNTLETNRKISYWFGARNVDEIFYQNEFDQLAEQFANFDWQVALSDETLAKQWHGLRGMIDQVVENEYLKNHRDITRCEFYICGPTLMNQAVIEMLARLGVEKQSILVDDFGV